MVLDDTEWLSANVAAAAMRTMVKFDKQSHITSDALPDLLKVAGKGVVAHYKSPTESNMTLYALQDVLSALSLLRRQGMVPMADLICEILERDLQFTLEKLQPRRCVEIIEAANALQLDHPVLLEAVAKRLSKSDALGKLTPPKLVEALHAGTTETAIGFMRRLCKQAVRRELGPQHVVMAIEAAGRLVGSEVEEEARRMAYSLVTRELSRPMNKGSLMVNRLTPRQAAKVLYAMSRFGWDTLSEQMEELFSVIEGRVHELVPADVELILQSLSGLQVNKPDLVEKVTLRLRTWFEGGQSFNPRNLNSILSSIYRLCGRDDARILSSYISMIKIVLLTDAYQSVRDTMSAVDVATYVWFLSQAGRERDDGVGVMLGNRLLALASDDGHIGPSTLTMSVRYAVKLYSRDHPHALRPFIDATKAMCQKSNFLEEISSSNLAFLIEALAIAKCADENLLTALAEAATRSYVVNDCSPSSSRRILSSFTLIVPRVPTESLRDYLEQMFGLLGGNLLSAQLEPYEAAEAVFAYAKAGYAADMGVFDHLSGLVSDHLSEYSSRTLSQCLWACGKMYVWEQNHPEDPMAPPYVKSAMSYAKHLTSSESELSPKDLAQCCWAIGRLRISDPKLMQAFASRAKGVLADCQACETSNILWGLSKAGYNNEADMITISRSMLRSDVEALPQEAACVLYALANAEIREDEVFDHLTEVLISQTQDVSAQAIANALWAHNVVGKLPPSKLLQSWAFDKIGLVGFPEELDPELFEDPEL